MANIHDIQAAAQALADAEATLHRTTAYRWIADITKDEPGED